jgi:hypothetical protein
MRTLCGILCFFLCLYMLTFARSVKVQDGNINVIRNGVKTERPRTVEKVKLTIPKPPYTGPMKTYSVFWVAIPLCYGFYCIYGGEKEHRREAMKEKT